MKNIPIVYVLAFTLVSCASSPMPESRYQALSNFVGNFEKCFQEQYITPKMRAETTAAVSYVASIGGYDQARLYEMSTQAILNANVSQYSCREVESEAYRIISDVEESKVRQKESSQELSNTLNNLRKNRTRYCNTIGTMTICN